MTIRHGQQEWAVSVNGEEIQTLSDVNDRETLDPTRAVSATTFSGFIDIETGDTITFERIT